MNIYRATECNVFTNRFLLYFKVYFKSIVSLYPSYCRKNFQTNYMSYRSKGNMCPVPEHCDVPWSEEMTARIYNLCIR